MIEDEVCRVWRTRARSSGKKPCDGGASGRCGCAAAAQLHKPHANRLTIAIDAFEALAEQLPGTKITDLQTVVAAAQQKLAADQKKFDTDTNNGTKPNVKGGDALLDASII